MIGHIIPPAVAAAAAALAPRARRCSSHAATMAAAAASHSASPASPSALTALRDALERSTAATGSTILLSNDKDKWPQAASALTTLSLSAAHCFISLAQCRRGLDLTELPPLVTLMRFRETCGLNPVIVLGDGSASCDSEDRVAAVVSETDDSSRISSLMDEIEKVFKNQEELARRPLPKLRLLKNSEWYRTNVVDFLVKTGRCYRVEDMQLHYQGDAGLPSASLSAFSRIIMRAHDWQQVCAKYGPSIQVDGSKLRERMRAQSMRTSLDHLRRLWNLNCLGVLLPPLHPSSTKAAQPALPVLDSRLASCYDVFQHFQGLSDEATKHHLCLLTLDPMSDIQDLMSRIEEHPTKRIAQLHLATRVVSLLYGRDAPAKAELTTELLFNRSRPLHRALPEELVALRSCLRSHRMKYADGVSLLDVLMCVNCFAHTVDHSEDSAASLRRKQLNMQMIRHEGFSVNAIPVSQDRQITADDILPSGFTVLGRGRKTYCVIAWE